MTLTLKENKPKRRDKLVIMTEILEIAKHGSSKTHIMFKANLSFSQLNEYLSVLERTVLLEKVCIESHEVFKPTDKVFEFMQMQQAIINLLNADSHRTNVKTSLFEFNDY